jgi:endonuclease YncB( thermonuclease family)
MFKTLHRLYVLAWVLLILGGANWLYLRSGVAEPAMDLYAVWRNTAQKRVSPVAEVTGQAVRVLDGVSFAMRGEDRQLYNVGLVGVLPPADNQSGAGLEAGQQAKSRLSELILSNEVRVAFTYVDPQRRGTGLVYMGPTNVNAVMIRSRLVQFKPEFVKALPLTAQYALLRADRKARLAQEVSQ